MAHHKTVHLKKPRSNSKVPESIEWEEYKDYLMKRGQLIQWQRSEWDSDNCATIKVTTDSLESWNEIRNKSKSLGDYSVNMSKFHVVTVDGR